MTRFTEEERNQLCECGHKRRLHYFGGLGKCFANINEDPNDRHCTRFQEKLSS